MAGVGSEPRDLPSFIRDVRKRVTALERRLNRAAVSPGPSGPTLVTGNWDDVKAPGNYYAPFLSSTGVPPWSTFYPWGGLVEANPAAGAGAVIQTVWPLGEDAPRFIREFDGSVWWPWKYVSNRAALPAPLRHANNVTHSITDPASTWGGITGGVALTFGELPARLLVEATFNAIVVTTATANYGAIGVTSTGGLNLLANEPYFPGTGTWANSPFSSGATNTATSGSKQFVIPAGNPITHMAMVCLRNTAATTGINYSKIEINPIRWELPWS